MEHTQDQSAVLTIVSGDQHHGGRAACWDGTHSVVSGRAFEQYRARWADLALGGLTVHRVPGDHLGIWKEPHVATLRDTVMRLLATGVPLADAGM